ncbi:MAG: 3-ketoacyl-ACP reductase, partial [Oscillospiraceae bacterium]|nr:3-ketoacyl-ACP reductase [Oscillospiraceae bacterium]
VTGSARGIGYKIAEVLGVYGYKVIMCATKETLTEEAVKSLNELNCDYEYIQCDITNKEQVDNLYKYIEENYGALDALVNNAGVAPNVRMDILETTEESFDRVIGINLKGTYFMCQRFANMMVKEKVKNAEYTPRIVNISSCSAYTSSTMRGEYCISKAGISMVTQLFADRLAEYDIPVFEVRPGIIKSDMTAGVLKKYEGMIENGLTPTKRMGETEDVAKCVKALLSGDFDFSTGQVINADGGFHMRRL